MNLTGEYLEATKGELAALCAFASKDETRPHLAAICIDRAAGVVCSTDGYRLLCWRGEPIGKSAKVLISAARLARVLSWKIPPVAGVLGKRRAHLVPGVFRVALGDDKSTIATVGAEVALSHTTGVEYPPIEQVFPKYKDGDPVACVAFQPRFLADLTPLIGKNGGVAFQPGPGELDPILVKLEQSAWTCVLMPFRAAGTYPAHQTPKAKKK